MENNSYSQEIKNILEPAVADVKSAATAVKTITPRLETLEQKTTANETTVKSAQDKINKLEKDLNDYQSKIGTINIKVDEPSPKGAFKSTAKLQKCYAQFLNCINNTTVDNNFIKKTTPIIKGYLGEETTPGSNLLHPEFETELFRLTQQYGQFRLFNLKSMGRRQMLLPIQSAYPVAGFFTEGADISATGGGTGSFTQKTVTANLCGAIMQISRQLLEDSELASPTIMEDIMLDLGRGVAKAVDTAVFTGNGVVDYSNGGILGLTTPSSSYQTVAQSGSYEGIGYDDLSQLRNNVNPQVLSNEGTGWFCNPQAIPVLQQIKDNNGRPIFQDYLSAPFTNREGFGKAGMSLFGYPVHVCYAYPYADTAGSAFITFGDSHYYTVGMREDFAVESSIFPYWTTHLVGVKGWTRVGASIAAPVTQYDAAFTTLVTSS